MGHANVIPPQDMTTQGGKGGDSCRVKAKGGGGAKTGGQGPPGRFKIQTRKEKGGGSGLARGEGGRSISPPS